MNVPGAVLLSPAALASSALVVVNDVWLKRHHPGVLSGKLSDVGLCVFLPLFVLAAFEWADAARCELTGRRRVASTRAHGAVACLIAVLYFVAVKTWPAATELHVAWLSALFRGVRFRAVTDPTDLVCLPLVSVAFWTMRRVARAGTTSSRDPSRR